MKTCDIKSSRKDCCNFWQAEIFRGEFLTLKMWVLPFFVWPKSALFHTKLYWVCFERRKSLCVTSKRGEKQAEVLWGSELLRLKVIRGPQMLLASTPYCPDVFLGISVSVIPTIHDKNVTFVLLGIFQVVAHSFFICNSRPVRLDYWIQCIFL